LSSRDKIFAAVLVIAAVAAVMPVGVPGRIAAYALVMLVPGWALYVLVERRPSALEALASGFVLSPVIAGVAGVLLLVSGLAPETAARGVVALSATAGLVAVLVSRRPAGSTEQRVGMTGTQWAVLGACILATLILVGVLPLTSEWWRFRSDAWFHRAVIAQIGDAGLPPDDPYFAGFTLQYMWVYHVLVLVLSRITSLEPFWVMPLLNLQSLAGVFLATLLFAGVFVRRFGHQLGSCLTVVFGLNGLFWLLLPLKAVRAFMGDVRGTEELARTYSLSPFDMYQAKKFVEIYFSQDFLLDKFVVATAFGLAFALMAMFWWATTEYLKTRRPMALVAAGVSVVGMLGFHTLFAGVMLVAAFGGLGLSLLFRRRVEGYGLRPPLELASALVAAVVISAPYLYAITHLKEGGDAFPFALSAKNIAGIVISCAAVIVLAAFQKSFFAGRDVARRFVQFALFTTVVFTAALTLPDANTYDKLPFFVFYPLAVVGGWTLADVVSRRRTAAGRLGAAIAMALLVLLPVNAICFAAYFNTPTKVMYSAQESALAVWVRENTAREAVFVDRDNKVFLLVAGPRRYYCGWLQYARQWEYDKLAMAQRLYVRDVLLGGGRLDLTTVRLLSQAPWELYIIDRGGSDSGSAASRHPDLFDRVYAADGIVLYRVDVEACGRAARQYLDEGQTEVPQDRLLLESGL